ELLVSVAGFERRVLDVATPRLRGVLTFAEPVDELLLVGDLAVVFGRNYLYAHSAPSLEERSAPPREPGGFSPYPPVVETTVTVVDLADPDRPRMLRTLSFTGTRVAARVVDGEFRFVLRSDPPSLSWTFPSETITSEMAVEANRELVGQTTVDDWLPRYRIDDGGTAPAVEGPLVACEDVLRPQTPGDLSMISVLTVDPEADEPGRATSVVGGGDTVYAEQTSLYVAGNRHPVTLPADPLPSDVIAPPSDGVTQVHQVDVGDPTQARYVASGEVQGRLLNSYALSAADGRLRVATTRQVDATPNSV
nr:beta-propeller domain-containing protein [Micromonospora sp. DSM 115978]